MKNPEIKEWLDAHKEPLIEAFVKKSCDAALFPNFAALPKTILYNLMEREWLGLTNFMIMENVGVNKVVEQHKKDARSYTADVPMAEQRAFFEERVKILEQMILSDPFSEPIRSKFFDLLQMAANYYKVMVSSIEIEARTQKMQQKQNESKKY